MEKLFLITYYPLCRLKGDFNPRLITIKRDIKLTASTVYLYDLSISNAPDYARVMKTLNGFEVELLAGPYNYELRLLINGKQLRRWKHPFKSAAEYDEAIKECSFVSTLLDGWENQTGHLSNPNEIMKHDLARALLKISNNTTIPVIINRLTWLPSWHCIWLLSKMCPLVSLPPHIRGKYKETVEYWLDWGKCLL